MKRSLFRTWRENRLIEQAMRNSAPPKAPQALKNRLMQQAMEAEANAVVRPAQRKLKLVWVLPAAALVLAACWIALHGLGVESSKPKTTARRITPTASHIAETTPRKVPTVAPRQERAAAVRQPRVARTISHRRLRHRRSGPELPQMAKTPPVQQPAIRVTVTRGHEPTAGYARVAAYSTDESGRALRTAWTLTDDPKARTSHQEMSIDDTSGQRQLLRVSVVMPSHSSKGEQL